MPLEKLNTEELQAALKILNTWKLRSGCIEKQFHFQSFEIAMEFINLVALEAKQMNHHPDWCNSYTSVEIRLRTHSIDGLSNFDIELAKRIDKINKYGI